ncbi:MAG: FtsW/RodA/SpoVE family cell cycle protein, partial [Candidatus Aquilonibacter sp.]
DDQFGMLAASGIAVWFAFQTFVNVGMTIGIMPITGIPLPFMSYGGSAILTDFAAVGVLMNIYSQKDRDVLGNA